MTPKISNMFVYRYFNFWQIDGYCTPPEFSRS